MRRASVGLAAALSCVAGVALGGPTREPPEASRAQVAHAVAEVSSALVQASGTSRPAAPGTLEEAIRHYVPTTVHAVDEGTIIQMPRTINQLMEKMPGAFLPEKAQGVNAVIHFKFTVAEAGEWNAAIADGKCAVGQGAPADKATMNPHR